MAGKMNTKDTSSIVTKQEQSAFDKIKLDDMRSYLFRWRSGRLSMMEMKDAQGRYAWLVEQCYRLYYDVEHARERELEARQEAKNIRKEMLKTNKA